MLPATMLLMMGGLNQHRGVIRRAQIEQNFQEQMELIQQLELTTNQLKRQQNERHQRILEFKQKRKELQERQEKERQEQERLDQHKQNVLNAEREPLQQFKQAIDASLKVKAFSLIDCLTTEELEESLTYLKQRNASTPKNKTRPIIQAAIINKLNK
jgi:hypothetical protein